MAVDTRISAIAYNLEAGGELRLGGALSGQFDETVIEATSDHAHH